MDTPLVQPDRRKYPRIGLMAEIENVTYGVLRATAAVSENKPEKPIAKS